MYKCYCSMLLVYWVLVLERYIQLVNSIPAFAYVDLYVVRRGRKKTK